MTVTPLDRRSVRREATRAEIVAAAWDIAREQGLSGLSMRDLGERVGMRAQSVYTYFASKDEILDEIVAGFAEQWSETVQAALAEVHSQDDLPQCVDQVLNWVEEHERSARVFFVTSVGATSSAEAVRRRTRNELARRAARTFREIAPAQDRIRVAIAGLGMVTLLEVVARSRLDLDASYRTLGPVRFRATAGELAEALIQ